MFVNVTKIARSLVVAVDHHVSISAQLWIDGMDKRHDNCFECPIQPPIALYLVSGKGQRD